jgi:hypothetical protein
VAGDGTVGVWCTSGAKLSEQPPPKKSFKISKHKNVSTMQSLNKVWHIAKGATRSFYPLFPQLTRSELRTLPQD